MCLPGVFGEKLTSTSKIRMSDGGRPQVVRRFLVTVHTLNAAQEHPRYLKLVRDSFYPAASQFVGRNSPPSPPPTNLPDFGLRGCEAAASGPRNSRCKNSTFKVATCCSRRYHYPSVSRRTSGKSYRRLCFSVITKQNFAPLWQLDGNTTYYLHLPHERVRPVSPNRPWHKKALIDWRRSCS